MKKQNLILVLLFLVLVWLGILSWLIYKLYKTSELHEFWIKTALDMAK